MTYSRLAMTLSLSAVCLLVLINFLPAQNRAAEAHARTLLKVTSPGTINADVSDFNGDGRADLAVFQPPFAWYMQLSSGPCTWNGGTRAYIFDVTTTGGDIPVPGDYSADLKTDLAVYQGLPTTAFTSSRYTFADNLVPPPPVPSPTTSHPYGYTTDVPLMGDYNGDGRADYTAVRRNVPAAGQLTWYVQDQVSLNYLYQIPFGVISDWLIPGDYDGDGKTDITVWRPSNGFWYTLRSSTGQVTAQMFGTSGDIPLLGDFDGDGKDDYAVFRPSNGGWYVLNSAGMPSGAFWGLPTDVPVPADYDGDGKTDIAVYRPGVATWYIVPCSPPQTFISPNFIAVPSVYVKQT